MTAVIAYVGLGSNLEDPARQIRSALNSLSALVETRLLRHSSVYRSAPWGYSEQPDFLNAVAELETRLSPRDLLSALLEIERRAGRSRGDMRWGPRSIDLDLLLYGDRHVNESGLDVPHPRMAERAFVVVPLAELDPALEVPGLGPLSRMLARVDTTACTRVE